MTYRRPTQVRPALSNYLNNSHAVPGHSPFIYIDEPTNGLLTIYSLDMFPATPSIPSTVEFFLAGTFKQDLISIELAFNITDYMNDGTSGSFQGLDDFCNDWAHLEQDGRVQCPPKKGQATISKSIDLPRGWTQEANYTIDFKLTSGSQLVTHIFAKLEILDSGNGFHTGQTETSK